MSPDKTQRIVLITGANRGLGLETARQLARRGFHAVIAARDEGRGRQAAQSIQAGDGKATFLSLDVSSAESIRNAVSQFAGSPTTWTFSSITPPYTPTRGPF
jgi:NAD(P)-dependent dehydrogenase (short-subunit alcohol dehydrogenase family)